ncbi:class I SAM-dependent methyltransferase [Streptacidiphilus rugosus]|uniref:class I SAM-dependent methyltransferase n=1 Tax=Streptacidiphilus rugosus TaxID=405783 RepID=UPI000569D045|nr:class I SAM-dependent methyltransferase [Streptacidiphilus rugosus]
MTGTLQIDPSNADQARAWDGQEGDYWAQEADQFDRALRGYQARFLDAAAIVPTDQVLDIGCGTGETTRDAARRATAGHALGLDLSGEMLRVARQRGAAEQLPNVTFEQADAQVRQFPRGEFDVAISRTGTMFFADTLTAFRNIARSLRPGGRLVQLVWQPPQRNEWFTAFTTALAAGRGLPVQPPNAPGPFALADADRVSGLLTDAGFHAPHIEELTAPMHFGADPDTAQRFVTGLLGWLLNGLDHAGRTRALADLRASIEAHRTPEGVLYPSATRLIITARA